MGVNGTVILVPLQLKVGISLPSNGRERMGLNGTVILAWLQLVVGISLPFNGRGERMDATGTRERY